MENYSVISKEVGVFDGVQLVSFSKFKKMVEPHQYTNHCYQVYLGTVGRLVRYNPYLRTRSKEAAMRMFYEDLMNVLVFQKYDSISEGDLSLCEKYSLSWS